MTKPWKEEFDSYRSRMGGDPISVLVDLGAGPHLPDAELNVRVRLLVHVKQAGSDGLVSAEERPRIQELDDKLSRALARRFGAELVGRVMVQGLSDLVFYAPGTTVGQLEALRELVDAERGDYDVDLDVTPDISWQFYREVLWPDAYEHQFIMNNRVLRQLQQAGDDHDAVRTIDHLVFLDDSEAAAGAADQLKELGFDTAAPEPDSEGGFRIAFTDQLAPGGGRIHERVATILDVVLPLQGVYDGWGCPVVSGVDSKPAADV